PGLLRRCAPRNDALFLLRYDQIFPLIDARDLAGADDRGAIELIENGRAADAGADVEFFTLIDGTRHSLAVEAHLPRLAQCVGKLQALRGEFRHADRRHQADAAHPIRDDLDLLVGRAMAELALVLGIEFFAQQIERRD